MLQKYTDYGFFMPLYFTPPFRQKRFESEIAMSKLTPLYLCAALSGLITAALTITPNASAQAANSPLAAVYSCKTETDPTKRLACYDAAVGVLAVKEANQEIVAIDAVAAKEIQREAFGFSLPSLPKLGLPKFGGDGEKDDIVELKVRSVSKSRDGIIITMENGQVWRGVNGRLNYIPKGDLTARIKAASMGSYRLSLSNGKERVRGLGVRRIE